MSLTLLSRARSAAALDGHAASAVFRGVRHAVAALSRVRRAVVALGLLLMLVCAASARAQCPPAWVPGIGSPGMDSEVFALTALPDGSLFAGGRFTTAGGWSANAIARCDKYGNWGALGSGVGGLGANYVLALAAAPSGDVFVGGRFTTAGGGTVNNIARYSSGGWFGLGSGIGGGGAPGVYALAVTYGTGDLIVGGTFITAGGVAANNIARYNSASGLWSTVGSGVNGTVNALAILQDDSVIVGGSFTMAGGVAANNIARCNPTTGVWSALGSGINGTVNTLAVLQDGYVITGGTFTLAGGVSVSNVAKINPYTGASSAVGLGTNGSVLCLTVLQDNSVFAGGAFNTAGGVNVGAGIARCNPTTGVWSALGSGTNLPVNALAILSGGDVVVGGNFTIASGTSANRIAQYRPSTIPAPVIATHPLPVITAPGGTALFMISATGGSGSSVPTFLWRKAGAALNTIANPSAATQLLRLTNVQADDLGSYDCLVTNSCGGTGTASNPAALTFAPAPACPADFNTDGFIDFTDFDAFVAAFEVGC